jgi:serine/threonine protein kinase
MADASSHQRAAVLCCAAVADTVISAARPSKTLGRYQLVELLAQGGMGEVHLAKLSGAAGFEKICIIKTILPSTQADPQFVERFQHEAKVLVNLSHANIAQVYDMGQADGAYYMALEYVGGVDLATVEDGLHRSAQPMPVPIALFIGQKMAEGLGYAHRKASPDGKPLKIVHRDVSPQNVMVSFEGDVKIIDFGLARSAARVGQTQTATVMGKLGYMSPEQARGEVVDARSDIYSAGVVLWEMLAGRPLVPHGTTGEMLAAMAAPRVPPLGPLRADLPAGVEVAILRALHARAEERYASADEFAAALAEVALRSSGLMAPERVGLYVQAVCPESYQSHQRLISRVSAAQDAPQPAAIARPAAPAAPVAQARPRVTQAPTKKKSSTALIVILAVGLPMMACLAWAFLKAAVNAAASQRGGPTTATPSLPPTRGSGGFTTVYGKATQPASLETAQFFKRAQVLEKLASGLNGTLRLPRDIPIVLEECRTVNAFFNPKDGKVHFCTELVGLFSQIFQRLARNGTVPDANRAMMSAVIFSLFHEVGHALIHVLDLPATGREEDDADQIATLVFTFGDVDTQEAGVIAAVGLAAATSSADVQHLPFWDEHALGQQRFYNVICWLYGANPEKLKPLVTSKTLPAARAARCPSEFAQLNRSWQRLLGPYLKSGWPSPPSTR